mgnify:CR=1 FL=1
MAKNEAIKRFSENELRERLARGEDKSDLARVRAMTNDEILRLAASDPDDDVSEIDWSHVTVTLPRAKQGVFLRLDPDVLDFFRAAGAGYQTRINAVLKAYVEAKRNG